MIYWLFTQGRAVLSTLALPLLCIGILAPLLFATLVSGIAGHSDLKKVGRMGIKSIVYFEVVTTLALFIGLRNEARNQKRFESQLAQGKELSAAAARPLWNWQRSVAQIS